MPRVEPMTLAEIGEARRALPSGVAPTDTVVRLIATVFSRDFRISQLEDEVKKARTDAERERAARNAGLMARKPDESDPLVCSHCGQVRKSTYRP